jgi:predicted RNA binding protein YcfA (HicA-like mRNA interferase family)
MVNRCRHRLPKRLWKLIREYLAGRFRSRSGQGVGEVVKALEKIGYVFDRQRGSHMILRQQNPPHRRLTVPDHKEVAKATLRAVIRQAGMTVEEFNDLL